MTCTKSILIERITEDANLDPKAAHEALETLLGIMKDTLGSGEDLMVSGFGKFCVNEKAPRKGRNPATGDAMTLRKRRVVTFKLSKKLRGRINGVG